MRIHAIKECSAVNGPGSRAVVWFQGCTGMGTAGKWKGCTGCWNPETHNPAAGDLYSGHHLADHLAGLDDIEGVTFSGGEPMQQSMALLDLITGLHYRRPDFSFGMYTGYTRRELEAGMYPNRGTDVWPFVRELLDFAVMGRYNQLQPVDQPLVTSGNQQLVLFSDRYTTADFPPQQVEYEIGPEGLVTITGFPVGRSVL